MKTDISKYQPCQEAITWFNTQKSNEEAFDNCERADWMLWMAATLKIDKRTLTLAKSICAFSVRHLCKDVRSKEAILVTFKFGRGKATERELEATATAAAVAVYNADAAVAYIAADAAYTTADAAYAADAADAADAAYTAAYAADAADAAYTAAYAAYAAADDYYHHLKTLANNIRGILKSEVLKH